ncbi:MAG: TPR end-of-group domain-containing protein [Woeseiaceae bacterium]
MRELFRQLQKRSVIKVGVAYLVGAWLVLQLADVIFPAMLLPEWSISMVLALLAVGFPLALILSWVYEITPEGVRRSDSLAESLPVSVKSDGPGMSRPSIAVLPFPDMSAEKDQEHFCDGLTDELLNVLTRIPNLRVASRTSSFSFKGKVTDLKAAADKLQVAHILEGSVRKSGSRIRVTAQLIEAATDSHLWSATYDRELDDIFVIQDDIAARILEALQGRLSTDSLPDRTTDNPKAYEYFLRGRGYAITAGDRDLQLAMDMFRKAVEIDPRFLRAWIELAEHSATYANFYSTDGKWWRLADEAAAKAMQLSPDSADGYFARGNAHSANQRFAEAEKDFRKALELDPKYGRAYHHLARAEYHQGKISQAMDSFGKATEHDPDDFESPLLATTVYDSAGSHDAARRTAEIGVARAEAILRDYPDNQRAYYLGAGGLYVLKQHDRAHEWIGRALALNPDDPGTRYNAACFFIRYGEIDKALDCLENSLVSRTWIENDPDLEGLRDHPRYTAILAALPR